MGTDTEVTRARSASRNGDDAGMVDSPSYVGPIVSIDHYEKTSDLSPNSPKSRLLLCARSSPGMCKPYESLVYVFKGEVECRDYLNTPSSLREGYVQWSLGCRGLAYTSFGQEHTEYVHIVFHMPAKYKVEYEQYGNMEPEHIPLIHASGGHTVKVLSGHYLGASTLIKTLVPSLLLEIRVNAGGHYTVSVPEGNTKRGLVYVCEGQGYIGAMKELYFPGFSYEFDGQSKLLELHASRDFYMKVLFICCQAVDQRDLENGNFGSMCRSGEDEISVLYPGSDTCSPFKATMTDIMLSECGDPLMANSSTSTDNFLVSQSPEKIMVDSKDIFKHMGILNSAGEIEELIPVEFEDGTPNPQDCSSNEPLLFPDGSAETASATQCDRKDPIADKEVTHNENYTCLSCSMVFSDEYTYEQHCKDSSCAELKPGLPTLGKSLIKNNNSNVVRSHPAKQSSSTGGVYTCRTCGKDFLLEKNLLMHLQLYCAPLPLHDKSGKLLYNCQICVLTFSSKEVFRRHYINKHEFIPFFCSKCGLVMRKKFSLQKHLSEVHKVSSNACEENNVEAPKESKAIDKIPDKKPVANSGSSVADGYKYKCSICSESLPNKKIVMRHYRTQHNRLPWFCDSCSGVYRSKESMRKHRRKYHGSSSAAVKKHAVESQKKKPASKGNSSSSNAGNILSNVNTSAVDKDPVDSVSDGLLLCSPDGQKHYCPVCSKAFSSKSNLKEHQICVHDRIKRYTCSICSEKFIYSKGLKLHMLKHSKLKYSNSRLGLPSGSVGKIQQSSVDNPGTKPSYKCAHCSLSFFKLAALNEHLLQCRKVGSQQKVRPSKAPAKRAITKKTSKLYICPHCPLRFSDYGACQAHAKARHSGGLKKISVNRQQRKAKSSSDEEIPAQAKPSAAFYARLHHCLKCPLRFWTAAALQEHSKRSGKNGCAKEQFVCQQCNAVFKLCKTLNRHISNVHEQKINLRCHICGEGFIYSDARKKHMLLFHEGAPA